MCCPGVHFSATPPADEAQGGPEVPPLLVIFIFLYPPVKHLPPPLVHKVAKRHKGNLVQGNAHQVIDVALCGVGQRMGSC